MYIYLLLVRADGHDYVVSIPDHTDPGDMIEFDTGTKLTPVVMVGTVTHVAYVQIGGEEYTMIQALHTIHTATKKWEFAWCKDPDKDEALEDEADES